MENPAIIASIGKRCVVRAKKSDNISITNLFECSISDALETFRDNERIREKSLESGRFFKII